MGEYPHPALMSEVSLGLSPVCSIGVGLLMHEHASARLWVFCVCSQACHASRYMRWGGTASEPVAVGFAQAWGRL